MTIQRFIGDVHGKFSPYKRLIKASPPTIQVGDMGVGFAALNPDSDKRWLTNPPYDAMLAGRHRFIRGNHDNPAVCRRHTQFIADGHFDTANSVMFVGGGFSIDHALRTENVDWWADEELSSKELYAMVDSYLGRRPRVMVTHDCPEEVAVLVEYEARRGKLDPKFASRTRQCFQSMWSAHSPKLWVFGHWHHHFDYVLRGTRFVCLAELQHMDFDLDAL